MRVKRAEGNGSIIRTVLKKTERRFPPLIRGWRRLGEDGISGVGWAEVNVNGVERAVGGSRRSRRSGMSRLKWVIIASSRKVEGTMVFLEGRSS